MRTAAVLALALLPLPSPAAEPEPKPDEKVAALLEPIRDKHKVPGLVAALVEGDRVTALAAVGKRKAGGDDAFAAHDPVHVGSCTKAMTATLIARLVERGKLKWDTTVLDVFPDLKDAIHPGFHKATLEQLLTHRAGVPADALWAFVGEPPVTEQRLRVLKMVLKPEPKSEPGAEYRYSNAGYAIAGAMAEKVTGRAWEDLMRDELFKPLGMGSAGFGPPGTAGKLDAPWGHVRKGDVQTPSQADNVPALGPAGTVHVSLPDWAKFVGLHLRGARGKAKFLEPATFTRLHTPPAKHPYAMGWLVAEREWAGGKALTHGGSNTLWYAVVWAAPEKDFAVLAAVNQGGDDARKACDDAVAALIEYRAKRGVR